MENVLIRPANINDINTIVELGIQTQNETFRKDNKPEVMDAFLAQTFTKEIISKELENTSNSYYITENNGKAIGYFKLRRDNEAENLLAGENAIELQRIYIIASEKGKGIGKLQINKCLEIAKKEGYKLIWLGVWEKNINALEFYKKMGFEIFASHAFDFGGEIQSDFMMRKSI
jgi:diamine N-acetyltransferase